MHSNSAIPVFAGIVPRDETQAKLDMRALAVTHLQSGVEYTIADRLEERALTYAERPFLLYGDIVISYAEANARANQAAHTMYQLGLRAGDVCALAMENRPEVFILWFALSKLGVTAALLNTQIHGQALGHALEEARASAVIVGEECLAAFSGLEPAKSLPLWLWPDAEKPAEQSLRALATLALEPLAAAAPRGNPPRAWRAGVLTNHAAVLVFTSGTTGLPKAAIYSHLRWLLVGDVMEVTLHTTCEDVFYCFLPLYHGAAATSTGSTALHCGSAILIRRRFSAREFWPDVQRHGVTTFQFVSEICRYLLNRPPSSDDRNHKLKRITGTGMTVELWRRWLERFGPMDIFEGWGATESNCTLINVDNRPGSVGRVPYWEKTNLRLVRYDPDSDSHPRDAAGHYIPCQPGEVGEVIGMIIDHPAAALTRFEGYTSAAATEKKILRNVLVDGDAFWRSGDLLRYDEDGYFWFVDRIGDTFRWKSENVSTAEVADTLSHFPGLLFVTVYGVTVPGQEGRCGMAALVLQPGQEFDAGGFFRYAEESLPSYARPQFVRLCAQADMTTTYKLRKVDLQAQGYDPVRCGDPLFVRDGQQQTYLLYTPEVLARAGFAPFV